LKTAAQESTMFLRSAHIRHYKSLDDVRVEFTRPITVIVGPNAVGKSNFVDALRFASETAHASDFPVTKAVNKRGGMLRIRQQSAARSELVRINLDFSATAETPGIIDKFETSVVSHTAGNYSIQANGTFGDASEETLSGWRYAYIFPNELRTPAVLDQDTQLTESGSNWASFIKALKRTAAGRTTLARIAEAMRCIFPDFLEVKVRAVGSYLVPHFVFDKEKKSVEFDPLQLSDGTLRIFGLLLAIYQLPAPTLLVIEEPEHTVYPGALGVLVDAMREASEQTQIILTTHSPDLVHYFKPDEIRVATIENGHTRIAPICAPQRAAIDEHLMTAEEFMRAEGLQPEPAQAPTA
jgi:predicted ATPase